jgi:hypothetical protein
MSKPIGPDQRRRRNVVLIVALVCGFVLVLILVNAYLLWDIFSMYFRMKREGGG